MRDNVRTLAAVASGLIAGIGLAITLVLSGSFVPPVLKAVDIRSQVNQAAISELQEQYGKIICLLTLPAGTTPIEAEKICGVKRPVR